MALRHVKPGVMGTMLWATLVAAGPAYSAPSTLAVEGVLLSAGGGPVADGTYALGFSLYADAQAKTAIWKEGPVLVQFKGGRFVATLGTKNR